MFLANHIAGSSFNALLMEKAGFFVDWVDIDNKSIEEDMRLCYFQRS